MKGRRPISFRHRLFMGSLLVALVPLVLCSLMMGRLFTNMLIREANTQGEEQTAELTKRLHSMLEDGGSALDRLAGNGDIQRALMDRAMDPLRKDTYLTLYQTTKEMHSQVGISLYDAGGYMKYTTQSGDHPLRLPVNWGILHKVSLLGGTQYMAQPLSKMPTQGEVCLRMARPVETESGVRIGYAECSVTVGQMRHVFAGTSDDGETAFLFSPQGRLLYASQADVLEDVERIRRAMLGESFTIPEDTLLFFRQEPVSGCIVVLRKPVPLSSRSVSLMHTILLAAAALCVVLCVLLSLALSHGLFLPIARLSSAMRRVHAGDLSARVPIDREDEIGLLGQDFNTMTEQLQTYVAEQVQHQKDLNAAQIRQMQAQLNPHFLYNTLDTMKWLAKIHKLPEVAHLAGSLAGILRWSITSEQFVTLDQELAQLERYIEIQKIRFADKFNYIVEIPPSLGDCQVPKLILQPLVENAILHGLNAQDRGTIYIYAQCEGETLTIAVTDDGCGMPPQMVERINSPQPKMLEGHLGLYNISCILKLYYSGPYGLHATSYPDVGTTVTVRLPITRGEEDAESGAGRG